MNWFVKLVYFYTDKPMLERIKFLYGVLVSAMRVNPDALFYVRENEVFVIFLVSTCIFKLVDNDFDFYKRNENRLNNKEPFLIDDLLKVSERDMEVLGAFVNSGLILCDDDYPIPSMGDRKLEDLSTSWMTDFLSDELVAYAQGYDAGSGGGGGGGGYGGGGDFGGYS